MPAPEPPAATSVPDPVFVVACREFVELVTEHIEGTLPPEMERAIAAHLELCDPCIEYLAQLRGTVALTRTLPAASLPLVVRNELLEVYGRLHGTRSTGP
jgi:Putative zinc-finger